MVEKKKKTAKKKTAAKKKNTAKKTVKASAKTTKKKTAAKKTVKASARSTKKKTTKKTTQKTPVKARRKTPKVKTKKASSNGSKPKAPAKPRPAKIEQPELDWMMWRIEKSQRSDPPYLNLVRAITYFNQKYGQVPNRCEVSSDWGKDMAAPDGITLTRSKSIQPHHLMLTVDPSLDKMPFKHPAG